MILKFHLNLSEIKIFFKFHLGPWTRKGKLGELQKFTRSDSRRLVFFFFFLSLGSAVTLVLVSSQIYYKFLLIPKKYRDNKKILEIYKEIEISHISNQPRKNQAIQSTIIIK